MFGEATKFSRFLLDSRKAYEATLRLGEETPTGDTESAVERRRAVRCDDAAIDAALEAFRGAQSQVPPMHSAVRVEGRRLYDYARAGEHVERPVRTIEVSHLERLRRLGDDLTVRVACSKGTYVRTLAQDIGEQLGCGAHLVALRRIAVGPFTLGEAVDFETLEREGPEAARSRLLPPESLVGALDRYDADAQGAERFGHGQVIEAPEGPGREVAVFAPGGRFLGVAARAGPGRIAPLRLVSAPAAKLPDFA